MRTFGLLKLLFVILIGAFIFSSCKKDPLNNLSNEETRIYITNYDTTADFSSYKTFSVDDSAAVIQNNQYMGKILGNYETQLILQLQNMMKQSGYTLVSKSAGPDLAVNISEIISTQTGIFSYGDYWDYYDYYYDPYYWGYPGYGYYAPYFVGTYTIQTNGLEVDLLDLKNATANGNKIKGIWTGLARGEDVFNPNSAAIEIAAFFSQSPYLKTTN
ncbi:MAG: DUF4136 domain-containing protein [Bacteroidetes bacterium]|nr:DUF4136 domain-containing protein [Bacteroidota bacterium]MBS1974061.1 DUF4136 domain-containing protein [Bacteroidota bacterium]